MSDHEVEKFPSISVMSAEVARQIETVTDPPTQQLAHLCELMQELRNEQAQRRHEETASSRTASSSSGSSGRSDTQSLLSLLFKSFQKSYHKPTKTLTASKLPFLEAKMKLIRNI